MLCVKIQDQENAKIYLICKNCKRMQNCSKKFRVHLFQLLQFQLHDKKHIRKKGKQKETDRPEDLNSPSMNLTHLIKLVCCVRTTRP